MRKASPSIVPVNRRLVISLDDQPVETKSGVLLPSDYKPSENKYKKALLLSAASDCSEVFCASQGKAIFVEGSMIEKINLSGEEVLMILENYVLGICR